MSSGAAGQIQFNAASGETNLLAVTNEGSGRFRLTDLNNDIVILPSAACTRPVPMNDRIVSCPILEQLTVVLDDMNDAVNMTEDVPMMLRADGAGGADNIEGGGLADVLDGGAGNDILKGDGGDDRILGSAGADQLDGGAGVDAVDYDDERTTGVTVNLGTGANSDGDQLSGFENIDGSFFDDNLTGDGGNNVIRGNPGADVLNDGGGSDSVSYAGLGQAVTVNLATNTGADGDTLTGQWEGAIGSPQDDLLTAAGAAFATTLDGRQGNDTLVGGTLADTLLGDTGADTLLGGPGADLLYGNTTSGASDGSADTASYEDGRTTTVVSSLAGEHQDADFYSDVQNLTGGPAADVLTGDAGANVVAGGAGNDSITGAAGIDILRAGDGDDDVQARDNEIDTVECGPGTDLLDADDGDVRSDCEPGPAVSPPPAPRCVVPNVKRQTVARARRMLRARRCTLGRVRRAYSRRVRRGRIISQSRRPGVRLPRGARVSVVVSRGRRRR